MLIIENILASRNHINFGELPDKLFVAMLANASQKKCSLLKILLRKMHCLLGQLWPTKLRLTRCLTKNLCWHRDVNFLKLVAGLLLPEDRFSGGVHVRSQHECLWAESLLPGINQREHPLGSTARGICFISDGVVTV